MSTSILSSLVPSHPVLSYFLAMSNRRRKDGGKNVKPPRSDHPRKNNHFQAFPKRHGPSHAGSGHAPPSVGFYSNKSVNRNCTLNNVFDAFRNDMCSMFDNSCVMVWQILLMHMTRMSILERERERKGGKIDPSPLVKSPTPKKKSKRGTTPKTSVVANPKVSHVWYIDSGAYRHMTGHRAFLYDYVERDEGLVKLADKTRRFIRGYRKMTNEKYIIKNVRYVEGLEYNLFAPVNFVTVKNRSSVHHRAICLLAKASKEDSWLWPRRLCHQNFKDMNKLVSRRLVSGLPKTRLSKDTLCPACEQGKMKRSSHPPKMETNCKSPLDMIHMDLCGPMRVESLGRKKYMLVFVDEFSRYTWLQFLRDKLITPKLYIFYSC
ncbi:hypothetical protein OSB04_024986 [Centaurea solstitialis]|uniref:GAG-pre-integrase domain-containing protein n=1 Tax=Centaurea solstitialis TaxID=347529 RepID=A0AA38SM90_9ASTR|nr:hypothetical protein OSB04_024986 [Centaurea solstitialis]